MKLALTAFPSRLLLALRSRHTDLPASLGRDKVIPVPRRLHLIVPFTRNALSPPSKWLAPFLHSPLCSSVSSERLSLSEIFPTVLYKLLGPLIKPPKTGS